MTFSYDGKRDVLKNVDMTFSEQGMTAIVGRSGCGKSTVVNMLVGAYRPKSGDVTVGGEVLENVTRESYYSRLASVSYNTYIFNDTVRANFELAKKNATDEEVWAALEAVNLADFIKENGGLDKVITEDANNVSGGQKQRLALAVNLVADKDIYVFDEATSNIDIESEAIIMDNIKAMYLLYGRRRSQRARQPCAADERTGRLFIIGITLTKVQCQKKKLQGLRENLTERRIG